MKPSKRKHSRKTTSFIVPYSGPTSRSRIDKAVKYEQDNGFPINHSYAQDGTQFEIKQASNGTGFTVKGTLDSIEPGNSTRVSFSVRGLWANLIYCLAAAIVFLLLSISSVA